MQWQEIQARPNQLPPPKPWKVWLILTGRGWGKTRTGAEWIVHQALVNDNTRWAIVARTRRDVKQTCFEGQSGIIKIIERYGLYDENWYNKTDLIYRFPNGSQIFGYSAEEPGALRGPENHGAWCDELAAWQYEESWDNLMLGTRLGEAPILVTTTPKPTHLIRELIKRDTTVPVRGSTFENAANLSQSALIELQARYEGTRTGRQELYGEILEDVEGALWTRGLIERNRLTQAPAMSRIVVSIDPAVTNTASSDETGIIVAGRDTQGHGYVLGDYSMRASPLEWATKAVELFDKYKADNVLVEVNQGGDMVSAVLKQVRPSLPIKEVRVHIGKKLRAEPVAAMYEQGRVHHIGAFNKLEDQMTIWTPDEPNSPDRLDAMVQAFADLLGTSSLSTYFNSIANVCPKCGLPNSKTVSACIKCGSPIMSKSKVGA